MRIKGELEVYNYIPSGWKVIESPGYPKGYRYICNGKSRWDKDFKKALIPEQVYYESLKNN